MAQLAAWGRRKGIALIGTGDCTHPAWLAEMRAQLVPAGDGLYRLREEAPGAGADVRFLVTGEISTIYKADGATRKVHHLVCLPDLDAAERYAARLERAGNIASDGRPILGLDSRDLLELLLEASPAAVLIPAHIWTPWFSVLGSKSGFDTIAACYRDLADHIFAVETGLSSNPTMNWMVSHLDRYTLVSNSDAHSAANLGREANVFTCEMGYTAVMRALRRETPGCWGTLEFFPEEGKYHFDGHRKCHFSCAPEESKRLHGCCPACGAPLTLGVEYRVTELADRPRGCVPPGACQFQSLLALTKILGELHGVSSSSKQVDHLYDKLLAEIGPELFILREAEPAQIAAAGGELLARAIEKVRAGAVHTTPGYDGEYGVITVFTEEERAAIVGQTQLFVGLSLGGTPTPRPRAPLPPPAAAPLPADKPATGLSPDQRRAVQHPPAPLVIVAGPGAGKTRTLVERIAALVMEHGIAPPRLLALTFSNRAAREMSERLAARLTALPVTGRPTIATFHKLGFSMIAEHAERLGVGLPARILAEDEAEELLAQSGEGAITHLDALERALTELYTDATGDPDVLRALAARARLVAPEYTARKRAAGALDFTDLLILPLMLLAEHEEIRLAYRQRWPHVFVDEYQDINVLQYLLLRVLCPPGSDICVIGDPDQAIYGFRGADVRYFLRFQHDYPDAGQITLTRNYRSCRTIVNASAQLIARGSPLNRRALWSDIAGPERCDIAAAPTAQSEAEYVVATIEALLGGISHFSVDSGRGGDGIGENLGFNDIAVLYRTHAVGEEVQQAFQRSGIPYQRAARKDIFQRADIRRALAALRDGHAGDAAPARALLQACFALGITDATLAEGPWVALLHLASQADDVTALLEAVQLERDIDVYDPRAARVALMTVHAAKGLEWDTVFMIGCEEGSFPHPASTVEEE
ncbi:MAG TPA: UvrD-helicase domain-containing protein, partial [Armatimonadota bacterium]|nr:UvrD-helicase domain-containing protein [Armatimonadota bacterium]